jgi:hypothetical protein
MAQACRGGWPTDGSEVAVGAEAREVNGEVGGQVESEVAGEEEEEASKEKGSEEVEAQGGDRAAGRVVVVPQGGPAPTYLVAESPQEVHRLRLKFEAAALVFPVVKPSQETSAGEVPGRPGPQEDGALCTLVLPLPGPATDTLLAAVREDVAWYEEPVSVVGAVGVQAVEVAMQHSALYHRRVQVVLRDSEVARAAIAGLEARYPGLRRKVGPWRRAEC